MSLGSLRLLGVGEAEDVSHGCGMLLWLLLLLLGMLLWLLAHRNKIRGCKLCGKMKCGGSAAASGQLFGRVLDVCNVAAGERGEMHPCNVRELSLSLVSDSLRAAQNTARAASKCTAASHLFAN